MTFVCPALGDLLDMQSKGLEIDLDIDIWMSRSVVSISISVVSGYRYLSRPFDCTPKGPYSQCGTWYLLIYIDIEI